MKKLSSASGIACSIFEKEIRFLIEQGKLDASFVFVDSELHMRPKELDLVLEKMISPDCLLCFGDCHARMAEQEKSGRIQRVAGMNCVEIFLGRETYRKLRSEGVFFLLPEWTCKWERIFKELLGFSDRGIAREFMHEMHTRFIYVNTGVQPVPHEILRQISEYFNLPLDVIDIELIHLENAIRNSLK